MSVIAFERQPELEEIEARARLETYAQSLSTFRSLGAVAAGNIVEMDQGLLEKLAFDDFRTAVAEMLKTDEELTGELKIDNSSTFVKVDGHVRAKDGQAMVDLVTAGAVASSKRANKDKRFVGQATRDWCDVGVVTKVDDLREGETLLGLSFPPKKDLKEHPEIYKQELGYDEDLAYFQCYSMGENGVLIGASYSIELPDEQVAREVLAEFGIIIPEGESNNTWLKHTITKQMTAEQAKEFVDAIRKRNGELTNQRSDKLSANEYIEKHQDKMRFFFNTYYRPLSQAIHTGKNNEVLQDFAVSLLNNTESLKAEVRRGLMRVANSNTFTDDDGKMMNSIIRYAVTEEMRKGLTRFKLEKLAPEVHQINISNRQPNMRSEQINPNMLLAQNVNAGIKANRSYGGCPGNIEMGENSILSGKSIKGESIENAVANANGTKSLQEVFGGKDGSKEWSWKDGYCIIKDCKEKGKKTKVGPCSICKDCTKRDDAGQKLEAVEHPQETAENDEREESNVVYMFGWNKEDKHEQSEPTTVEHAEPVAA